MAFAKVLVANRGEIAVRIIRACRELNVATVAVYSDADRFALHAQLAGEAVRIGPPPATESYLTIAAIIRAARETGAEAIHPGYGFLAENAEFARGLRRGGSRLHWPTSGGHPLDGLEDGRESRRGRARRPHGAGLCGRPAIRESHVARS